MKALVLKDKQKLVWDELPTPEPGPGQVRVQVMVCGICGSDVPRVFEGTVHSYPIVLGHEFSGIVDKLGEGVEGLKPGTHVVGIPLIPCGECPDCAAGNYSLCSHYSFIGSRQNGAMAEYVVLPKENILPISTQIPFEQAATIEPSTVALHAIRLAGFAAGKSAAVLGCGIIGLYTLQWLKILGAASVTAIGRGIAGLDAAASLGADSCISTSGKEEKELIQSLSATADYVFESSGSDQTMKLALRVVRKRGTVCYIGTPKSALSLPVSLWEQINRKECMVTGSWMSYSAPFPGEEWSSTIEQMRKGALRVIPGMVAGVYDMKDGFAAFEALREGKAKGRVLLRTGCAG